MFLGVAGSLGSTRCVEGRRNSRGQLRSGRRHKTFGLVEGDAFRICCARNAHIQVGGKGVCRNCVSLWIVGLNQYDVVPMRAELSRETLRDRCHDIECTDSNTQRCRRARCLCFSYCDDTGTIATLAANSLQCAECLNATNAIGLQTIVLLKVGETLRGQRTENAICFSAVETETCESHLELFDIVAAQVWRRQIQEPRSECPRGFDQCLPCGVIARIRFGQAPFALKSPQSFSGAITKHTECHTDKAECLGCGKSNLKVANETFVVDRAVS